MVESATLSISRSSLCSAARGEKTLHVNVLALCMTTALARSRHSKLCSTACICCRCGAAHRKVVHCWFAPRQKQSVTRVGAQSAEAAPAGVNWRAHRNSRPFVYSLKSAQMVLFRLSKVDRSTKDKSFCGVRASRDEYTESRRSHLYIVLCHCSACVFTPAQVQHAAHSCKLDNPCASSRIGGGRDKGMLSLLGGTLNI
jgi:hypothetical protein